MLNHPHLSLSHPDDLLVLLATAPLATLNYRESLLKDFRVHTLPEITIVLIDKPFDRQLPVCFLHQTVT